MSDYFENDEKEKHETDELTAASMMGDDILYANSDDPNSCTTTARLAITILTHMIYISHDNAFYIAKFRIERDVLRLKRNRRCIWHLMASNDILIHKCNK